MDTSMMQNHNVQLLTNIVKPKHYFAALDFECN